MSQKRKNFCITTAWIIVALSIASLVLTIVAYRDRVDTKIIINPVGIYTSAMMAADHPLPIDYLDFMEDERIKQALINSIGTDEEIEKFGYSFTTLCCIIDHEGGDDYTTCWAVATCLHTATVKCNGRYNPVQMAEEQQFASPHKHYTGEALQACIEVFVYGNYCPDVEDATVFHCKGRGNANYHDDANKCEHVWNHNGVDYYRELKDWSKV